MSTDAFWFSCTSLEVVGFLFCFVRIDLSCKLISVQSIKYFKAMLLKEEKKINLLSFGTFFPPGEKWSISNWTVNLLWWFAETVRAMTHVINQGMAMYWGTSRWSPMEIMVSHFSFFPSCSRLLSDLSNVIRCQSASAPKRHESSSARAFWNEPVQWHFLPYCFDAVKCHVEVISHPKQCESDRTVSASYNMFTTLCVSTGLKSYLHAQ